MDLYLLMRFEVTGVNVKVTEANNRLPSVTLLLPFIIAPSILYQSLSYLARSLRNFIGDSGAPDRTAGMCRPVRISLAAYAIDTFWNDVALLDILAMTGFRK
ncbi:hypothetical protein DPMN_033191 [Dreissena polymorpha]|uniref:Uncharacterized protein n=1 Tax=Dreissena polymorpha TaxID=45954 RepID=A0A9D4RJL8_DREPO|nr:hypothetical protein DPMN_033191 [Dreissena polymorpha]